MTKLMITLAASAAAAVGFAVFPAPAEAQQNSVAEIIVFGNDPCPRATDDQIVVCRRVPETYRYRLPESFRPSGSRQEMDSWVNKSEVLETVGDTGTFSCSPVGPGGYTGCLTQIIKQSRDQRRQQAEDSTPDY